MTLCIGITGGIASGKSTAVAFLRALGYEIVDSDALVHELQAPGGKLFEAVKRDFGAEYLTSGGELDRKKLSNAVFADVKLREKLSSLQDGIIREELTARRLTALDKPQKDGIFFMDLPLLFELDYDDFFDETWLIATSNDLQLERLMARNQLTLDEAKARVSSQMPLDAKKKRASRVIDNSGTLDAL